MKRRTREEIDTGIRIARERDKEWRVQHGDTSGAAEEGKPAPKWTGHIWPGYEPPDPHAGVEKELRELNERMERIARDLEKRSTQR